MALGLWYAALRLVTASTGVHALVVAAHVFLMSILSFFNHTGCDFACGFLGLRFAVRSHETHHRLRV